MIFTATVSVLSALKAAPGSFAASDVYVISDSSAPTIFSSQIDASLGPLLESFENITGASSEIFAFSSWNGVSFTIRGVDLDNFNKTGPEFTDLNLLEGISPTSGASALVGSSLLKRLDVRLPTTLPLVGSYSPRIEFVRVVGSFTSGSALDDELLVSLDVARALSGVPQGKVSIIRVATISPDWLESLLSPDKAQFLLYDMSISKGEVRVGDMVDISLGVRNWGKSSGSIIVHFSVQSQEVAATLVKLGPSGSTVVTQHVLVNPEVPASNRSVPVRIDAWIKGDLPMSLSAYLLASNVTHTITAPNLVALNHEFNVTVTTYEGAPAIGAVVDFQDDTRIIDSSGQTSVHANLSGTFSLEALYNGTIAAVTVDVVDFSGQPSDFLPMVVGLSVAPTSVKQGESASGTIILQNNGIASGTYEFTVSVDNEPYFTTSVFIDVLGTATARFQLQDLAVGSHAVQAGNFSVEFDVQSWIADNPDLVELLIKYGGTGAISRADSIPIFQAAKISEGNISVALTAVGTVSALLAALAITAIFSKEIHEGRRRLGILKTIGATSGDVRRLVLPQALENGLAGAAIGVAAGIILLDVLSKSAAFLVFGHRIEFAYDAGLLILIMLGAVVIGIASALVSAMVAVRETTIASVRKLPEEPGPEIDFAKLLGDE